MKVCVIGTGYVGLVAGTCLAEVGNDVICVDNNKDKLNQLKKGVIPIFEPGLEELIKTNVAEKRLHFSSDLKAAIQESLICFIAVGTPTKEDSTTDLTSVYKVVDEIAQHINGYKIIVDKSTVPIGTGEDIKERIKKSTDYDFDVISNPEFLKQGSAVENFQKPDRIIIGSDSEKAIDTMKELYSPFTRMGAPILVMDIKSAEMTKYAANAFLAMKISFANQIASICEKVGADVEMVRRGICADNRIGNRFLFAGLGYGGSCFPKDVKALLKMAKENNCEYGLIEATDEINQNQRLKFIEKITSVYGENLKNITFAIWGLSFKPKTNDMREAPSITIIEELLKRGAKIKAFDPKAMDNARIIFGNKIEYAKSSYDALKNADAMLLITDWNEFKRPDFEQIKALLKTPVIFDGRNQYDPKALLEGGFKYFCIGK